MFTIKNNMYMKKILLIILISISLNSFCQTIKPNIVIIYADDMGYSDVGYYGQLYNTPSPASTPYMDAFASEAKVFTNAHSSSAICTPSRYSLLTGKYNWRTLTDGVSEAYGSPLLPDSDTTIAEYLKSKGYSTAAFGKWHLGGYIYNQIGERYEGNNFNITNPNEIDWEHQIEGHALDHGFDVFRGKHNAINRPPHLYVEGRKFQYYDTTTGQFRDALNTDTYSYFTPDRSRAGLGDPSYDVYDVEPIMISQVEQYIQEKSSQTEPFFAYVALNSPHKPWVVTPDFENTESFEYGDFMREVDHRIGRILDAIDNNGLKDSTIVIITSDNGPSFAATRESISNGKDSNGPFRGVKTDSWEGGTRVPFMIRWPGIVKENSLSSQLIWQGDIFQTIADYLGDNLPSDVAPDAISILPVLDGRQNYLHRDAVISASVINQLSIQTANGWKLIDGTAGAGSRDYSFDSNNDTIESSKGIKEGSPKQLFYLPTDIGEHNNIQSPNTDKVAEMLNALNRIRDGNVGFANDTMVLTMNTEVDNSGDTTIPLPFVSGAYDVDFGNDGTFELMNQTGSQTVDLTTIAGYTGFTPGNITIAIRPNKVSNPNREMQIQFFDIGPDNVLDTADDVLRNPSKLVSVNQWGNIIWTSMKGAFGGCDNMTFAFDIDIPNFNKVEDMSLMFLKANSFNTSLSLWDVSCVTNMNQMFFEASSFNQDVGSWDVSHVTSMIDMFFNATAFNTTNYDSLLNGWSQQELESEITFRAPPVLYCLGKEGKNILTSAPNNWTIIGDAGLDCPDIPNITFDNFSVFLKGPFDNNYNLMNDHLRVGSMLPTISPYGDGVTANPLVFNTQGNNAIVDWVLIELRNPLDITNVLYSNSGLLQRDGDVVSVDGISPLIITDVSDTSYYVSVSHRNHVPVSSNLTIDFTSPPSIDLTTISNVRGGSNALTQVSTGIYAMFPGDANGNYNVQITDYTSSIMILGTLGYNNKDVNLNGNIETTDINLILEHIGKSSQF